MLLLNGSSIQKNTQHASEALFFGHTSFSLSNRIHQQQYRDFIKKSRQGDFQQKKLSRGQKQKDQTTDQSASDL